MPRDETEAAGRRLDALRGGRAVLRVPSDGPRASESFGRQVGALLPPGSVVSLEGKLGAGKTCLARGILRGLGIEAEVLSPSFILIEEYAGGPVPVMHADLYRLEELGEVERLGLFDAVDGVRIVIVEWGDRLPAGTLDFDVRIALEITGPLTRTIVIEAPANLAGALAGT